MLAVPRGERMRCNYCNAGLLAVVWLVTPAFVWQVLVHSVLVSLQLCSCARSLASAPNHCVLIGHILSLVYIYTSMLKALIRGENTNTFFMVVFFYYLIYSVLINLYFTFDLLPLVLLYSFLVMILSFKWWDIFEERKALFCWVLSLILQGLYVTFESALRRLFSNSSRLLFSLFLSVSVCVCELLLYN